MRSMQSPAPPSAARSSTPPSANSRKVFGKNLPSDPAGELIELGRAHFAALEDFPEARAFWWPRFTRIAHWFARWELERRAAITAIAAEIRGEIDIPLAEGTFKLRGIADRIERDAKGRYVILDYKTGSARTEKQVRTGLAPQLTLEAAILRKGGFKAIPAEASVAEIVYVTLKGGEPPGEYKSIAFKEGTPDSQADRALEKLAALARRFDDDNEPYRSLVHPMWTTHYGEYDHLARVKEWSSTGGAVDDGAGAGAANENAGQHPARRAAVASRSFRSGRFRMGRRQRRIGQDPCAGAARDQSLAQRRAAGENPLPHLHQGGRRQHGQARVRHARPLDHPRR